ncbi:MAG: NUDIX hydrolase [Firmicutes bacterium]|nr:NUDIX hydrolase [Bacillota bacterium]
MDSGENPTRLASDLIFASRVFSVCRERYRLGEREVVRDVVHHPGAVVMVPLLGDGRVVMVRQWRAPAGRKLLELPAGTLEPGEEPAAAAERELQEEIGYRAGRLTALGSFYSAPGFCTERLHLFLAEDLVPDPRPGDEDEAIEVVTLPLGEALEQALRGELQDAKTIAGLCLAAARLGLWGAGR